MSRFLTDLDVRRVRDTSSDGRGTWSLLSVFMYESDVLGKTVVVPAGFVTDFASVPRVPVAFLLAGDSGHEAAVIHDWLYYTHEVTRSQADAAFREALVAGGESWRSWLMWAAVRLGGGFSWDSSGQRQPEWVQRNIEEARAQ